MTAWDGKPANLQPHEHALVRWFRFVEAIRLEFAHPLYAEYIEQFSKGI
ncbi:MAG: hypothetical protein M3367_08025 [Acidobacteriota bacterium]|nr:hypothetical protein [Acidobacteriota bacterium]